MHLLLISTYELGRQPFGVASPTAWLKNAGHTVTCLDLSVQKLDKAAIRAADAVCFYVPMHTATRMALPVAARVRALNPAAHLCFYGLYASVNEALFRSAGAGTVLGGEFESGLVAMAERLSQGKGNQDQQTEPVLSLERQEFITPDRTGLPDLTNYGYITLPSGERRTTGYTESSRGCKHLCRHCPVVPVYGGQFRVVPRPVVLADIAQQVEAGARHITFGDPDFFNGPGHAVKLVTELRERWPDLSYDVTIKVQHLLQQRQHLATLRDTGCVLVTTAVESVDPLVLEYLDKRHTASEFAALVALCRDSELALNPTFVTFTPWTTLDGYITLLGTLAELDLVENVSPIQYAIRLLIPNGSRLLELEQTRQVIQPFDQNALVYPWHHPDPRVDALHRQVLEIVQSGQREDASRIAIFDRIWTAAHEAAGKRVPALSRDSGQPQTRVPHLSEPWYC